MMISVFNRLVVIVVALAILAGAIITIGAATHAWPPEVLGGWLGPQLARASAAPASTRVGITAIGVVIAAAMIGLLMVELVPNRASIVHTLSVTQEGTASIENESLCLLAERTGETVHGVQDMQCYIRERNGNLTVRGRAVVSLGANLLEVNPELKSKIRDSIEQLTGLSVETVNIKFKYHADKRGRVSVR